METKDWIYSTAITATAIIGLFNFYLNYKNRKNAIREHLYKEQLAAFIKLSEALSILSSHYEEVQLRGLREEGIIEKVRKQLDIIYLLDDIYYFLLPDEIVPILNKVEHEAHILFNKIIKQKGIITNTDLDPFYNVYYDLQEDIREFHGVDELSAENRKVAGNQRRREKESESILDT